MMIDKDSSAAGKPHGKRIWKSIQNGPTPHPKTTNQSPEGGAVPPPKNKRDEEFTEEDNRNELADIHRGRMKGSGQTLERRKEALFDEFEHFCANRNELIQDYFVRKYVTHAKNNTNMSTITYVELFTHLRTYEEHALKSLKKKEQSSAIVNPLAYLAKTTPTYSTTSPVTVPTPQSSGDSHNDAMLATMNQIANMLSGLQKQRASGNTGTKGIQTTGSGVNNLEKKVICYNCRVEGHVARQCKEQKCARDSSWYHDKALLMQAKKKGVVLDAKAEAFLADVKCTAPYDQPLALTTTNLFEANHEDAYDFDVDEGPHASAAFMANLSSTGGTNGSSSSHINEYQNGTGVEAVPTVVYADEVDKQSMIAVLQCMHTKIAGYVRVNDKHKLVNETLTTELEWCKIDMQALERNKVKHDLDMAIVERNNRNAEHVEENVMLKEESLVHVEVCKIKMAKRPEHALPINYAKFNALYDQFVPQKEFSREQVYWLPATEIASQSSTLAKPVAPFVHTRPV
nr:hypothetical protein [Tanacetum cinerariifolium]